MVVYPMYLAFVKECSFQSIKQNQVSPSIMFII